MMQLSFDFRKYEKEKLKNIVKDSVLFCRKKFPRPVGGETMDEYKENLKDEILLEIAERLKKIVYEKKSENMMDWLK